MEIDVEKLKFEGVVIDIEDNGKPDKTLSETNNQDSKQTESDLLQKMKRSYVDFFDNQYESKLPKNGKNEVVFPILKLKIDDEENEIVFNYELFEQLCDVYIVEGWDGILAIETEINKQATVNSNDLVSFLKGKPIALNSWNLEYIFFQFTKRMLALLIRETLANIERVSAERIIAKLSITNIEIAKAWGNYKIQRKSIKSDSLAGHGSGLELTAVYSLDEKSLAKDLFDLLTKAVTEKNLYDLYVKKIKFLPDAIKDAKSSSNEPNSFTSDPIFRNQERINAEKMASELPKYLSLKDASQKLLKTLTDLFEKQHPLGLLIFGSLKKNFEQSEMENLFGLTIDNLRKDLESIAEKINPKASKVEELIPFKQTDDLIRDILVFKVPANGIEKNVLEKSLENFAEMSFFPMLAEANLNQLFSNEIIEIDSFENVVGFHYLSALIKKLGEIEKEEKKLEGFWITFGKISSGLSLATLVTPETAGLYPIIRGGAAIADIALFAYTVSTITGSLKKNNKLLQRVLVNQDDFTTESFSQIGEVITLKKEFSDNLTEQLAIEILNIVVLGNLPVFKELLLARNYYFDLETIAGVDETGESSK